MATVTEQERAKLPEELRPVFDQMVEEYKYHATVYHRAPFVSPKVIAALVRDGWRPSAAEKE